MSSLLSTAAAATFLEVSEASVRRWADRGMLPVQRIGRRQERRFREDDLRAFLEKGKRPARGSGAEGTHPVVAIGGASVPTGSHLATFYDSDAARVRLAVPFLQDGLRRRQSCLLMASGASLHAYLEPLHDEVGDELDLAERDGLFMTAPAPGTNASAALASFEDKFWAALADGATLIRVVGEMISVLAVMGSTSQMLSFEQGLNLLSKRFPSVTLCQYDVREFNGETILQAIKTHPDQFDLGLHHFLP
jgi:excisionase family DNA binding protein